jgi:ATP-binding cassette subfamily B protein
MSAAVRSGEPRSGLEAILEEESLGRAVDRRLLARLWPYVRPYRAQVVATLLLVLPMFVLELAPAWLVKTGLDRVILAEPAAAAGAGGPLDGLLSPPAGLGPLAWLGLLFLGVVLIHSGLSYVHMVLMATTGQAAMRDLRAAVFRHIESLHMGFFDSYPVGRLVTRATNDVESVSEMFSQGIVALVTDLLKMVGFAVALFLVNPLLAVATFSVVPVLALAAVLFRLKVRDAFRTTRVLLARINAWIQESVTGMKVVQLFTREERNLRDFARLNAEHRDAWKQSIRYDAALFSTVELAGGLTVAILLWWGTGAATPGVLYLFIQWMRRFFMPLSDLSAKYSVMQSSMASVERIFQLMDRAPAIRDPALGRPGAPARSGDGAPRGAGSATRTIRGGRRTGCCAACRSAPSPARRSPSSARRVRARPPSSSC